MGLEPGHASARLQPSPSAPVPPSIVQGPVSGCAPGLDVRRVECSERVPSLWWTELWASPSQAARSRGAPGRCGPSTPPSPSLAGVPTQDVTHTPCSLVPEACRAGGRRPEVRAAEPSTQSWPGARAEWLTPGQSAPVTRPLGASAAHTPTVPPSHTGPPGGDVRGGGLAAGPAGPLLLFPQAHPTAAQQPERRDARDRVSAPAASPPAGPQQRGRPGLPDVVGRSGCSLCFRVCRRSPPCARPSACAGRLWPRSVSVAFKI